MKFSRKKLGIFLGIILVLVVGILIIGGLNKNSGTEKSAEGSDAKSSIAVNVASVEAGQETEVFSYTATLEPCAEGIISSTISGKVVKVMAENGQTVSQGKALIKLDDRDIQNNIKTAQQQLAVAQSQLKSTQSQLISSQTSNEKLKLNLENAQRSYDQAKALFEQGAAAKTDVDNAESVLKAANVDLTTGNVSVQASQAAVETAQANVNLAKVSLNNYTDSLNNTTICAPIAGVLDEKNITLGQYVSPGTVLAKIKNVSTLNAVIHVDQNNISQLRKGMPAQIKLGDADTGCSGTLNDIGISADATNRTYTCKVTVANGNQSLHPGDFVTVNLMSDSKTDVITIPLKALAGDEGDYSVFILENGLAKKVNVSIGQISENRVVITSGLVKDQSVIVTNLNLLQDGDAVTVVDEGNNG